MVVGGGAGGVAAARALAAAGDLAVTLVEPQPRYTTCFYSNHYLGGLRSLESLTFGYDGLRRAGVEVLHDHAVGLEAERRRLRMSGGEALVFDRLVVSPGIGFRTDGIDGYDAAAREAMPHAYASGADAAALMARVEAMRDGGLVLVAPPEQPYRCPTAPYERVSMLAHYLAGHKPHAKILVVDAKNAFPMQTLFQRAWRRFTPEMVEWLPYDFVGRVTGVDAAGMAVETEYGDRFEADVINLIPPQRAGDLAIDLGLADGTGWCPVNYPAMRSRRIPEVHVMGDSVAAGTMPKAATAAVSQAAPCAAAIRAELLDAPARGVDELAFTCWSFLAPGRAARVSGAVRPTGDGGVERARLAMSDEDESDAVRAATAEEADAWYERLTGRLFG